MNAEKESCIPMIQKIVGLSNKAREGGILALEEYIEHEPNFFLKTGLHLLVDGVSHENTKQVMQALCKAYQFTGSELQKLIITYGILMIQAGISSKETEDFLYAMPDEKLIKQTEEKMSVDCEAMIKNAPSQILSVEEIETMMNIKK